MPKFKVLRGLHAEGGRTYRPGEIVDSKSDLSELNTHGSIRFEKISAGEISKTESLEDLKAKREELDRQIADAEKKRRDENTPPAKSPDEITPNIDSLQRLADQRAIEQKKQVVEDEDDQDEDDDEDGLDKLSLTALKSVAKEHHVELHGASKKADIIKLLRAAGVKADDDDEDEDDDEDD